MVKEFMPVILVVASALLLYNVFPTEVSIILWLILTVLIINKWDSLKSLFN